MMDVLENYRRGSSSSSTDTGAADATAGEDFLKDEMEII
jgi:hypothetical protein